MTTATDTVTVLLIMMFILIMFYDNDKGGYL